MQFGVIFIALGAALSTVFNCVMDVLASRKLLHYNFFEQLRDFFINIIPSLVMGGLIYCWKFIIENIVVLLVVQVACGVIIFVGLSYIIKNESFMYLFNKVKRKIGFKKKI
jgi:hypothetical protein